MAKRINKCEDISILIGEMVLGTISGKDKREVEKHLLGCSACRDELKDMRSFYNLIGDYRLPQPDPAFSKRMKAAVFREMQNDKQPGSERSDERTPWYRRPRLMLALTTTAAVGLTAIAYVAISPYISGLGSEPEPGGDSVAGSGVAALTETRLPYTSRDEGAVSPSLELSEEPAPKFMAKEEESYSFPASPTEGPKRTMKRGAIPDKYTYWESTLAGRDSSDEDSETIASTSAIKRDTQTSTDFDEEYLKAMHRSAGGSGSGYAGGASGERGASGRWGSWSHPDVGIETTAIGGASSGGYISYDDDIYSTLLELSPEERERVLDELSGETEALK